LERATPAVSDGVLKFANTLIASSKPPKFLYEDSSAIGRVKLEIDYNRMGLERNGGVISTCVQEDDSNKESILIGANMGGLGGFTIPASATLTGFPTAGCKLTFHCQPLAWAWVPLVKRVRSKHSNREGWRKGREEALGASTNDFRVN